MRDKIGFVMRSSTLIAIVAITMASTSCGSSKSKQKSIANMCNATSLARAAVLKNAAHGSNEDFALVVNSLRCLDGGDLEDAYITIGKVAFDEHVRPTQIRRLAQLAKNDLTSAAIMLPGLVDDFCGQKNELERRKSVVEQRPEFSAIRSVIAPVIEAAIAEIAPHC